ncbi:MAG TPA: DinB family protein [Dinghuibacter sp.]|uniref:DinB family protein n=1 Tax=Dinghuibacter sp. TaxID=2024697 RepID=UPI002B918B42|nr:DinB family protein [Dinghuibacter sp.]HTJ10557.1 DinB family protein [Dinghuibacter sp.]
MNISALRTFYKRDLDRLYAEIESYRSEEALWRVSGNIANSAGNLCMHLVGNLNTYIGARLGGSGYVRDRPFEFAGKGIPRATLLAQVREVAAVVDATLAGLGDRDAEYPEEVSDGRVSVGYFLTHLAIHLGYHLGQINYHRRLLDV